MYMVVVGYYKGWLRDGYGEWGRGGEVKYGLGNFGKVLKIMIYYFLNFLKY